MCAPSKEELTSAEAASSQAAISSARGGGSLVSEEIVELRSDMRRVLHELRTLQEGMSEMQTGLNELRTVQQDDTRSVQSSLQVLLKEMRAMAKPCGASNGSGVRNMSV